MFALFNGNQVYRAIAAAITFKTFAQKVFMPEMKEGGYADVGAHIGIDQKTVLVRKIGLMRVEDRTDRQNEVWAGKPVNMAAKLASLAAPEQVLVSERYFNRITNDYVRLSCGCQDGAYTGERSLLWTPVTVGEKGFFDFETAFACRSLWCERHGAEFCEAILGLDG